MTNIDGLSEKEISVFGYLQLHDVWNSPNVIGEALKPDKLASYYSAWACPILKRLVKKGYALRNSKGQYKAIVVKRGI